MPSYNDMVSAHREGQNRRFALEAACNLALKTAEYVIRERLSLPPGGLEPGKMAFETVNGHGVWSLPVTLVVPVKPESGSGERPIKYRFTLRARKDPDGYRLNAYRDDDVDVWEGVVVDEHAMAPLEPMADAIGERVIEEARTGGV